MTFSTPHDFLDMQLSRVLLIFLIVGLDPESPQACFSSAHAVIKGDFARATSAAPTETSQSSQPAMEHELGVLDEAILKSEFSRAVHVTSAFLFGCTVSLGAFALLSYVLTREILDYVLALPSGCKVVSVVPHGETRVSLPLLVFDALGSSQERLVDSGWFCG